MDVVTKTIGERTFKFAKWSPLMGIRLIERLKEHGFHTTMKQAESITNAELRKEFLDIAMKRSAEDEIQASGLRSAVFILCISGSKADESFTEKDAEFILDNVTETDSLLGDIGAVPAEEKKRD